MEDKIVVPPNWRKTPKDFLAKYQRGETKFEMEQVAAELQLMALGDVIPLNIKINTYQYEQEIAQFKDDWVDYLPRTDRVNNRQALSVSTYPGWDHRAVPSLPEAKIKTGNETLQETDFSYPTAVWEKCQSLHPVLNLFAPLGRTFLVRCNMGGYFYPHRDHPEFPRNVFRVLVFLKNCEKYQYDFMIDDKRLDIEEGRAYYINTRLTHRTFSFVDDSTHLIMNIPMTIENSLKVLNNLQHTH